MGQADYRKAAVDLIASCATASSVKMQIYPARPASLYPPTGFIDSLEDDLTDFLSPATFQHVPTVNIVLVWGLFDSKEAADQRDAWIDAFHDIIRQNYHQAGANTLIRPTKVEDDPAYVPDWLPLEKQRTYYATTITLKGDATD